jgi:hypothetical protein
MNKFILTSTFFFAFLVTGAAQNSQYLEYIDKYRKLAVKEMERAGVPASIKLAQALLESNAGQSELARKSNNHFGIKCGGDWKGKTYEKEDDDYDAYGNLMKSCFRKYKSVEDSYIGHSEFLRDPKKANRYGFLFRLDPLDYKRWAKGLRTSGYATGANYDDKLVRIIETYKLHEIDEMARDNFFEDRPENMKDLVAGLDIRRVNDVKVVFAKNKITVQDISTLTQVSMSSLEKYNEMLPSPADSLADETRIYLQPKRCSYRGKRKFHYVAENEKMLDISNLYGVKLKKLYRRNRMPDNSEPQKNERIKLKGWKIKAADRPRLTNEKAPTSTVPVLIDTDDDFMDEDVTPQKPPTPKPDTTKPTTPQPDTTKPDTTKPTTPTTTPSTPAQPSGDGYHTVVKGDTLYNVSKRYGLTVDALMRLNNLTSTNISLGQVLRVKGGS